MATDFDGFGADSSAQMSRKHFQAVAERNDALLEARGKALQLITTDQRAADLMAAYVAMDEVGRNELWRSARALQAAYPRKVPT